MKLKRLFAGILALAVVIGLLPAISPAVYAVGNSEAYTFDDYTTELGTNWNPHAWQTASDETMLKYLQTPFVDYTIKDSATNEYQWIFLAATDIRDVTASHQDDLVKYNCDETAATEGYVYEFSLQPELKWEDGTPINADAYIYSMQALLDSQMQNCHAQTYTDGVVSLAGAKNYAMSGQSGWASAKDFYTEYTAELDDQLVFALGPGLGANSYIRDFFGFSDSYDLADTVSWLIDNYIFPATVEEVAQIEGKTLAEIKADPSLKATWEAIIGWWQTEPNEELDFFITGYSSSATDFGTVGLYKVDDYTIRFVCQNATAYDHFLSAMTTNWLVYEPVYEACKDLTTTPVANTYGTSAETTMSYGPYKLASYEVGQKAVFVRNENYFEYNVDAVGHITSTTSFIVDGAYVPQWTTDKIVLFQMSNEEAREAFLAGKLDVWMPTASERIEYANSDRLYKADDIFTLRLFFNCDLDVLKRMDTPNGNRNSAVLSSYNFRKALSLAIDRSAFVTTTPGYNPEYALINSMSNHDVYNGPDSIYRNTIQAKQAMCELYGVEYTEENYNAITGYDLEQARALMAEACRELIAQGLYTQGEPVVIRVAWSTSDLSEKEKNQLDCLNYLINEAAKDSGFGKIILQGTGAPNLYKDVANGQFAIGYGAWSNLNLDTARLLRCYTDPEFVETINEAGCWDPSETHLTLTVNGVEETMTYTEWNRSVVNGGKYADAAQDVKLSIMAQLEKNLLNLYYCIPLASTTSCSLLSVKVSYYTRAYNDMCGFGGLRLMRYHYSDAQWEAYIASNELDYSAPAYDYAFNYDLDEGNYPITGSCGEALTWSLSEDGVLTISGTGDMWDFSSENSAPWYSRRLKIKSVVIESGVTGIGDYAFPYCTNMASVSIPDSVTDIGAYAFSDNDSITEITIPESVTSIGECAFASCNALNRIMFKGDAPSIAEDAFWDMVAIACYPENNATWTADVTQNYGGFISWACGEIDENLFAFGICGENLIWQLTKDGALTISGTGDMTEFDYVMDAPWHSWQSDIRTVVIESGVTSICQDAFSFCVNLTSVTIPDTVTKIDASAFYYCESLTSVTIPDSVTSIGWSAFGSCDNLAEITFEGDVPRISEDAFYGVTATVYYPAGNATWTEDVLQNYGGTITWVSQGDALEIAQGDVNGDGKVDTTDAKLIMQYDLGIIDETALNLSVADVNGDGKIDTTDAKLIMQLDLGIITEFPKP